MPRRRINPVKARIVSLFFANVGVLLLGLLWLDYLGLLNISGYIKSKLYVASLKSRRAPTEAVLEGELYKREQALLEKERRLQVYEEQLKNKEHELALKEQELRKKEEELEKKWEELRAEEQKRNEREKRLQELAYYFSNMKPDRAVKRLEKLDDQTIIDIFDRMDKDVVAYYLMIMNPDRAARIAKKLERGGEPQFLPEETYTENGTE